jgi:Sigma-70 region 2
MAHHVGSLRGREPLHRTIRPMGGEELKSASLVEGELEALVITRAKAGDSDAVELLLAQYGVRVFKTAFRITGQREDAEDVVQETFLRVCGKLSQFRGDSQFSTWLTRVAMNQAITVQRKQKGGKIVYEVLTRSKGWRLGRPLRGAALHGEG